MPILGIASTRKPIVTGGTLSSDATYYYRKFTANGNFTVTGNGIPLAFDYVIVGGGGGGGAGYYINSGGGSGGGAGGVVTGSSTLTNSSTAIVIGAGGVGISFTNPDSTSGSPTTFISLTANGGGYGGYGSSTYPNGRNGANGGSGGGGGGQGNATSTGGTGNQGNNGGTSTYRGMNAGNWYINDGGAGGGGAGAAGSNGGTATSSNGGSGGAGGAGVQVWTTGNYVAGGGGGSASVTLNTAGNTVQLPLSNDSAGGLGGGGRGNSILGFNSFVNPQNGTANTGGGGGGGGARPTSSTDLSSAFGGLSGGSGVVWVRYLRSAVGG